MPELKPFQTFILKDDNDKQPDKQMADWTPKLDLRGQTFGSLTPLEPAPKQNGKPAWLCRCEACGKEKIVKTKDLRRGAATSCGCQWKKRGVQQMQYVDGTCIEMLTSTKVRTNNSSGHTGIYYDQKSNKYRVEITLQRKRHYIGRFTTLKEAVKAREIAKTNLHQAFIDEHSSNKLL